MFAGGFNFNVSQDEAISKVLEQHIKSSKTKDKFGVHLNEFSALVDEEDLYDASNDTGPDPPYFENIEGYVPYCTVDTPERPLVVNYGAYDMVRPGYTVIIYGPRRSGKSAFIAQICQRLRPFYPDVVVFTMTKASGEYFQYVPYDHVIEGLDEDLLEALIMNQRNIKMKETRGEFVGNYNLLIIIDDCMAEKLRYKDIFNKVFFNGRHYNITLIVSVQDVKGIAPAATLNADRVYTFSLPDRRARDTIREKFCDYLSKHEFDALYDSPEVNKKYHMLSFDIAHRYNDLDTRISIGCCEPETAEPFVMGDRHMWNECLDQLTDLGFDHLIALDKWDIVEAKPKQESKNKK